jgi:hypothetical protein
VSVAAAGAKEKAAALGPAYRQEELAAISRTAWRRSDWRRRQRSSFGTATKASDKSCRSGSFMPARAAGGRRPRWPMEA